MRKLGLKEEEFGQEMKIKAIDTDIDGLVLVQLREIVDDRGAVLHMLRSDSIHFTQFGECYFSEVLTGAIKAWKKHSIQTQNLVVPVGRICLVVYDNRATSITKGRLKVIELGRPDAYQLVQIPPGLWYGFRCLSLTSALVANCADYPHTIGESEVLDKYDSTIPYSWT